MRLVTHTQDQAEMTTCGAVIVGPYRYTLWRAWDMQLPRVLFILLNPSTADETYNDPTIRRCIGFARSWGFGSVEVVNLFAYRTPYPGALLTATDPIGSETDRYILQAVTRSTRIIAGWGEKGVLLGRNHAILRLLSSYELFCLGLTRERHPRHPLYIRKDAVLVRHTSFQ